MNENETNNKTNNESDHEINLMEQFSRAVMLLHRYQHQKHGARGPFGDPHRGQGRVLSLLKMKPEISQKELAYLLDMRNQSLGELLTKLEKAGFITRKQSEADRRVMDIRLTEAGAEAAEKAAEKGQDFEKLFDCLNEEEQKNLSDYLSRLIQALVNETGDEGVDFRQFGPSGFPPEMEKMRGRFGFGPGRNHGFGRNARHFDGTQGDPFENMSGDGRFDGGRPDFAQGREFYADRLRNFFGKDPQKEENEDTEENTPAGK